MSTTDESTATSESRETSGVDFKLEVVVIPVSDVDRAKAFYESLGWRLDADFATSEDFRVVQFTPTARCLGYLRHRPDRRDAGVDRRPRPRGQERRRRAR